MGRALLRPLLLHYFSFNSNYAVLIQQTFPSPLSCGKPGARSPCRCSGSQCTQSTGRPGRRPQLEGWASAPVPLGVHSSESMGKGWCRTARCSGLGWRASPPAPRRLVPTEGSVPLSRGPPPAPRSSHSRGAALGPSPALPPQPGRRSLPGLASGEPASRRQAEAGQQPLPPTQRKSRQRSEGEAGGEEARRPGRAQACRGGGRVLTAGAGDLRGPLPRSWRFS